MRIETQKRGLWRRAAPALMALLILAVLPVQAARAQGEFRGSFGRSSDPSRDLLPQLILQAQKSLAELTADRVSMEKSVLGVGGYATISGNLSNDVQALRNLYSAGLNVYTRRELDNFTLQMAGVTEEMDHHRDIIEKTISDLDPVRDAALRNRLKPIYDDVFVLMVTSGAMTADPGYGMMQVTFSKRGVKR